MRPVLLDIMLGGVHVRADAYAVFLWAGALAGLALALVLVRVRGLPFARSAAVLLAAAAAIPLGARVLHVLTDLPLFAEAGGDAFEVGLSGFALYGGLLLAIEVAVAGAWLARVDLWRLADAAAPGIGLGIALAKLGCFCEGCCQGTVTDGPFGVVFPLGSAAHGAQLLNGAANLLGPVAPVVPVQLIEVVGALSIGVLALLVPRWAPDGVAFLTLAAGYSAVRLIVLPMRWLEPTFIAPSWFYPVLYLGIIGVCVALIGVRQRTHQPLTRYEGVTA